jgi:hypothetical protein
MSTTSEAYRHQGIVELGHGKVRDKQGRTYYPKKAKSPLSAIKFFCRECMGMDRTKPGKVENAVLVRECCDPMCPLYDFRMGQNPFLRRVLSEDQKQAVAERLTLARASHKKWTPQNSNAS